MHSNLHLAPENLESLRIPVTRETPDHPQSQLEPLLAWGVGSSQERQEGNISLGSAGLASFDLHRAEQQERQTGSRALSWLAVSTRSPGALSSECISQPLESTPGAQQYSWQSGGPYLLMLLGRG